MPTEAVGLVAHVLLAPILVPPCSDEWDGCLKKSSRPAGCLYLFHFHHTEPPSVADRDGGRKPQRQRSLIGTV